ncbi:unnamed protein product [Blepharisma stoltei]|uniref:Uncharacterized protein n=1 Tax=Blepharisma stoltei TaxID=1481888 RepID=A0AAU9JLP8_9CILI|nr:unnamed protein product [Blepharisma stoltei]
MGCGIPQKSHKKKEKEEEDDTSLHNFCIFNASPIAGLKINQLQKGNFSFNVKGIRYNIVISDAKTPEKSQVFM